MTDQVTAYATAVKARRIVAGRLVRLACQRHLDDVAHADVKGLVWRADLAERGIEFFSEILCLPEETAAEETVDDAAPVDGSPFVLRPWQQFIVGSLLGWYTAAGARRFRDAFIETAKGSGKTPLGAGLMLYLLVADGERGAQVYFASVGKAQAKPAFAVPEKRPRRPRPARGRRSQVNNLAVLDTGSYCGRSVGALRQRRVQLLIDEGTKPDAGRRLEDAPWHGPAQRADPANDQQRGDRTSICWHDPILAPGARGTTTDATWFAHAGSDACAACARGRQFPDLECADCMIEMRGALAEGNPHLGVSVSGGTAISSTRRRGGRMPWRICCGSISASASHTPARAWASGRSARRCRCGVELLGRPCWGGLDLDRPTTSRPGCACGILAPAGSLKVRFWIAVALTKYPHRPYADWIAMGRSTTEGDDGSDLIGPRAGRRAASGVRVIGFDKRFANQLALHLQGAGLQMVDTPQGFALNEAIRSVAKLIADGQLAHGDHAILTWMMDNTVLRHGRNQEVRLDKDAAKDKIDGPSALVMANARRIAQPVVPALQFQMIRLR